MKRLWGLRGRLIVLLVFLTLLPLMLFTIIFQRRLVGFMREDLAERMEAGLEKADKGLTRELESLASLLQGFCTDPDVQGLFRKSGQGLTEEELEQLSGHLRHLCERGDGLPGMALRLGNGEWVYYDTVYQTSSESPWLKGGLCTGDEETAGQVSESACMEEKTEDGVYLGPMASLKNAAGEELHYFTMGMDFPLEEEGKMTVYLCVDERRLQTAMEGIGGETFFLEKNGVFISAPDASRVGDAAGSEAECIFDSAAGGETADGALTYGEYMVREEEKYAVRTVRNELTGWNVVELYPMDDYLRELWEQRVLFFAMACVILLLVVGFILFVTRPLIISVDRVLDGMKRVENGDYSVRLTMNRGTPMEIREITEGFNSMTEQTEQLLAQVRKAAEEQKNAEISALEAQIDPHFLYNTLDTINWKAIAREEYEISEMVGDLGDILRYAIKDAGGITTLGREIVWLKKYVRLQQEKLGYEVQIFCDVSSEAAGAGVHKMLLQPLVENSIRHGLEAKLRQPILVITGIVREGMLYITVGDNGRGMDPDMVRMLSEKNYHRRNHFGIENVRKRLTLYYGEAAGLSYESKKGQYTRVTLRLPMMEGETID